MPKYQLHDPIYEKLPTVRFSGGWLQLAVFNSLMKLQRRSFKASENLSVTTHKLPVTGSGALKVMHFKPEGLDNNQPSLVYFHGGAFFLTYGLGHFEKAQAYAIKANVNVFLVSYRLSKSHPFPTPFNDCYQAFHWVKENAQSLGISNKLVLIGESAGGALAAGVAQKALDQNDTSVQGQILIYPVTDCEQKTESAQKYVDTPVWDAENNKVMWDLYLRNSGTGKIPDYAAPIHRQNFAGLPAAYIEVAEFDPLYDEGLDYAKALEQAGVSVEQHKILGAVHGYDFAPKSEQAIESMQKRCEYIKNCFA